jgi:hypothetical protein
MRSMVVGRLHLSATRSGSKPNQELPVSTPKHAFKISPMNARKGHESNRRS